MTPRRALKARAQGLHAVGFSLLSPDLRPRPSPISPPPCPRATTIVRSVKPGALGVFPTPRSAPRLFLSTLFSLGSNLARFQEFGVSLLIHALKVFEFLSQWIRKGFLTSIFSVSPVQHLKERFRVLRQPSIAISLPERVPSWIVSRSRPFLIYSCDL